MVVNYSKCEKCMHRNVCIFIAEMQELRAKIEDIGKTDEGVERAYVMRVELICPEFMESKPTIK